MLFVKGWVGRVHEILERLGLPTNLDPDQVQARTLAYNVIS